MCINFNSNAAHRHETDVDVGLPQDSRHAGNDTRLVVLSHQDHVALQQRHRQLRLGCFCARLLQGLQRVISDSVLGIYGCLVRRPVVGYLNRPEMASNRLCNTPIIRPELPLER